MRTTRRSVKIADEVWIATALLHRENPPREDFTIEEIVERAGEEAIAGELRPGVYVHVVQHCVANRAPNPARYRMLFETRDGYRRLFRFPEAFHFQRDGAKTIPQRRPSQRNIIPSSTGTPRSTGCLLMNR